MSSQPHAVTDQQCPGCCLFFSPSGLSKHLAQTRKAACVAFRDGDNGRLPSTTTLPTQSHPDAPPQSSPFDDVDMDAPPVDFEGDFFGNYDPGFFDEDELDSSPGVEPPPGSDNDDDDDGIPELDRWEPEPRRPSSLAGELSPVESEALLSGDSELRENTAGPQGLSQSSWETIEVNASTRKTFVVRFPSHRAGAATLGESDVHTGLKANKTYHAQLLPTDADNPYHPFANRLDWLVARWAKMRVVSRSHVLGPLEDWSLTRTGLLRTGPKGQSLLVLSWSRSWSFSIEL